MEGGWRPKEGGSDGDSQDGEEKKVKKKRRQAPWRSLGHTHNTPHECTGPQLWGLSVADLNPNLD